MKAVITFCVIDEYGEKCTCNMIESLDKTFGRVNERMNDLEKRDIKYLVIIFFNLWRRIEYVKHHFRSTYGLHSYDSSRGIYGLYSNY